MHYTLVTPSLAKLLPIKASLHFNLQKIEIEIEIEIEIKTKYKKKSKILSLLFKLRH